MNGSSNCEDLRLGPILRLLFLIPESEIQVALTVSHDTGMPLGSVLVAQGKLMPDELRVSIHAQSLLKDRLVDAHTLTLAKRHLNKQPMCMEGALRKIGWQRDLKQPSNRLGELLMNASVLTPFQLATALAHQRITLEPLGRALARLSFISKEALRKVLLIQEEIRSGLLRRKNGIELICDICSHYDNLKQPDRTSRELVDTLRRMPSPAQGLAETAAKRVESTTKFVHSAAHSAVRSISVGDKYAAAPLRMRQI